MKYAFIREQRPKHRLNILCSTLGVSTSGYHDWLERPLSKTARDNKRLVTKIRCFHKASRSTYGSPRIQKDLTNDGEIVSRQRVARLMKSVSIESKMAKRFVITTHSKNTIKKHNIAGPRHFKTQLSHKKYQPSLGLRYHLHSDTPGVAIFSHYA